MYSIVLFIVDTSLSGFFGSGDRPTSAVDMMLRDQLVRRPAGELDVPGQAQLVAQRHQLVEAVARADQREGDVVAAELVHHDVGGPHHDVHAVLRAHDADVRGQVPAAPALAPGPAGPRWSLSGSGPVRTTVTSPGALPLRSIAISR